MDEMLPNEIWVVIIAHCDLTSVYNLMLTSKRLNECCQSNNLWLIQWRRLIQQYTIQQQSSQHDTRDQKPDYKNMCKRFIKIYGHKGQACDFMCSKCQGVLCRKECVENSEELIIFDFGSKTTWFKYESENTGQLSMHPTVSSLVNLHRGESTLGLPSNEDPLLTESCPVCSKMLKRRLAGIGDCTMADRDKKRFSSAFTKLSLKGFHCFDSSQLHSDETEYTVSGLRPDMTDGSSGNTNETKVAVEGPDAESYLFLMSHMLKRNAFLPGKNIPFVICEPNHQNASIIKELTRAVFEELKVPGLCFIPKPVAVALYIGLDTCLVVDSGANNTVVTPVINQKDDPSSAQRKSVGGTHISAHLKECVKMKGVDFEVDEVNLDSSQVKRECWVAYNPEVESKKKISNRNITVKGKKTGISGHFQVNLSHELYLAVENMYLNIDLASMIASAVENYEYDLQIKLLSNIVLSGGNCRLNGLRNRLTRDLQEVLPSHSHCVRVCDPRLMTGRTDAVVGASYIKKWDSVQWMTRKDYVLYDLDEVT